MATSSSSEPKVALVTGSSSGIGAATVRLLSRKGYKVVVTGSKQEKVDRVAKECAELSPEKFQPLSLILDFSDPNNGEVAVRKTVEHFGRLDVLVNNSGIFARSPAVDPTSYESYRRVMAINTDAAIKASLTAVEHLQRTKGNMIFVSSVASVKVAQYGFAYGVSKAALSCFARCLAVDLAPDVRVNIVSPGPVATPIFEAVGISEEVAKVAMANTTLQHRIGNVDEIARTIAFLISDEASFIHGHELFIDGGYILKPSNMDVDQKIIAAKKAAAAAAAGQQ